MNIAIILAAGEGTRMKSKIAKPLHKVCGKPMLQYIIDASIDANVEKHIVIVGHGGEEIKEYFQEEDLIFEEQPVGKGQPYGTGYAVMQAVEHIDDDSTVIILFSDTPLITETTIDNLIQYHTNEGFDGTVLTALLEDATGYGRIKRDKEGNISKIIEHKDANEKERKIKEINSGIFCFRGDLLKSALTKLDTSNTKGELYLTDIVEILNKDGYKLGAYIIEDPAEIHGVNSKIQLSFNDKIMRQRINEYHMSKGITIVDPDSTYIEPGVNIGIDTIIYPGVTIEGNTEIGTNCIIRGSTRIVNSTIKDNITIESSLIEESIVQSNTNIGPNAHLRPKSHIGENVNIGNFVEVKNAYIGDYTKAGHLSYIGDATVGKNVNIGCGVVFVNYDGKNKHMTTVGDNAFVGSNCSLVAPLKVNDWGYIAAGSIITKEVEEGALSIGRPSQVNKEDWVKKKGLMDTK